MNIEQADVDSLHLDPANVRKHPDRNLDAIKASLARFGQQKPIVVDANNVVRAGNGTLAAAKALGWDTVAVVRTSLKGTEATAYAIADNRTGDLAEWDELGLAEQLRALQSEDFDLDAVGYTDDEVDALLKELADEFVAQSEEDEPPSVDRADELLAKWKVEPGQLWVIPSKATPGGEHRVLCGDSTKAEDVARVMGGETPFIMVTDPPYGVEYDPTWRDDQEALPGRTATRMTGKVENDDRVDWTPAYRLFPGDVAYVWHAGRFAADLVVNLKDAGYEIRTQIIWRKQNFVISRGHYHWQHEPCWYAVKKSRTARWCGDRTQSTIWDIANASPFGSGEKEVTVHGTQKPVECMARPMRNHGERGDIAYDPFLGSGTTIVAAEQTGRLCRGIEIAPKYVAVILERLANLGLDPQLQAAR